MKMKTWMRWTGRTLAAAGIVLLAGCATPKLADVQKVQNDEAAYLVFSALGREPARQQAAERIAARAFEKIQGKRPASPDIGLEDWTDYVEALSRTIEIDRDAYKTAPELKTIKDTQVIAEFIRRNPDVLKLDGATALPAWGEDLATAKAVVSQLTEQVAAAIREAEQQAKAQNWGAAYLAVLDALDKSPKSAAILKTARQFQQKFVDTMVADMGKALDQVQAIEGDFGTKKSSLDKVAAAEQSLSDVIGRLDAVDQVLRDQRLPISDKKALATLTSQRAKILSVSAATWAESIRLHAAAQDYWTGYQLTRSTLTQIAAIAALRDSDAAARVLEAYRLTVEDAVRHLLELANDAFYNDRFGLAFIASRMSREFYDFALAQSLELPASVATLVGQADQTAADVTARVENLVARRLLITDFVPAVTEDYENLGFQIRTRCRYLSLPGNGIAWGLDVPAPKSLTPESIGSRMPTDILLSGIMEKKVNVDIVPPVELERGYQEVGTDRIVEVPNPMAGLKDGAPKIAYQQEIHLYPWIKTVHRKQARIAVKVSREQPNMPVTQVYYLDDVFPNEQMSFKDLAVESEELTYQPLVVGAPRIASSRAALTIDTPPTGKAPDLAPDDEIKRAVINHVMDQIIGGIQNAAAQFPVEVLGKAALTQQAAGQARDAANSWGHFLVYIRQLVSAKTELPESWLTQQEILAETITQWNEERWQKFPPEILKELPNAWPHAAETYQAAKAE
ncbi:MAG: hypothetical protein H7A43_07410 [Verrucomicrobia bacterium]|nr:hypothetical protein [Verrucomicrobiota bacterium]